MYHSERYLPPKPLCQRHWAAQLVFNDGRLHTTRSGGGVLIYLSLFERQVRILTDSGAAAALPQEKLEELVAASLPQLRRRDYAAAFTGLLEALQSPLARTLPPRLADRDELPNLVLTFHPRP